MVYCQLFELYFYVALSYLRTPLFSEVQKELTRIKTEVSLPR